jgi:enamine deaminase RidA (YjgF/YER057c/UK114 family)
MIRRMLPYAGLLHEVVEHKGVLYLAGIVSEDLTLDMSGQTSDVLRQLDALLEASDSDRAHVLSVVVYLSDLRDKDIFNQHWREFFALDHLPARAAVGVGELGPDVRLEIVVTAAKRE